MVNKLDRTDKLKTPHITYEELLRISSFGIVNMHYKDTSISDSRYREIKSNALKDPVDNAFCKGLYTGSPGKDLFRMLPYLTDEQMGGIADVVAKNFPTKDPGNHVNVGAFLRYMQGQFEKNNIFSSEGYFKKKKEERRDLSLPRKFEKLLMERFKNNNNLYGVSILYEMSAHRFGDEAVLYHNKKKLKEMENSYNNAVKYAFKCNSYKQMFTPYYWAFEYFKLYGNIKKALVYAYRTIENASKYCPDCRDGYRRKLKSCVKYIAEKDKGHWDSFCKRYASPSNNDCVEKAVKKMMRRQASRSRKEMLKKNG